MGIKRDAPSQNELNEVKKDYYTYLELDKKNPNDSFNKRRLAELRLRVSVLSKRVEDETAKMREEELEEEFRDLDTMAKVYTQGFVGRPIAPSTRKPKKCEHTDVNYVSKGEGELEFWCRDCGETTTAKKAVESAKKDLEQIQNKNNEPPHESEVIQRLSEAYRENEREIEQTLDEETSDKLGTIYKGR